MAIYGMMLARNEEGRWLERVLTNYNQFCDKVFVLDDASTDKTADICCMWGAETYKLDVCNWETNEVYARKYLWELVKSKCQNNDWIICLDADELLVEGHISYLKYLMDTLPLEIDGIGFRLFDMWNDDYYREDEFWKAHKYLWPMAVRYKENFEYKWADKTLHCGRFALNSSQKCYPTMIPIKHMGWSRNEDRIKKYDRYMKIDPEGKNGILAQYESILDDFPTLKKFGGCPT